MKKPELDKIVKEEIEYIDQMPTGIASTTARIAVKLGYGNLSFDDLFYIEDKVMNGTKHKEYRLDKSSHNGKVQGLPFNLDFIKIKTKWMRRYM